MSEPTQLLPCPCCEAESVLQEPIAKGDGYTAFCSKCGIQYWSISRSEVFHTWNRRELVKSLEWHIEQQDKVIESLRDNRWSAFSDTELSFILNDHRLIHGYTFTTIMKELEAYLLARRAAKPSTEEGK